MFIQDEEGRCYSDSVIEFCEHENKNSGTTGEYEFLF